MPLAIQLPKNLDASYTFVVFWFCCPFLYQLLVDFDNESSLMRTGCELATLGKKHRDLVDFEHAI